MIIFLAGAIFSIGDGVLRLTGHAILGSGGGHRWIAFVVLGIALASEGISFVRAFGQTRKGARQAGLGLVEFVRVSKEPTTKMVFPETPSRWPASWDAGAAILIGLLLVYVAYAPGRDIRGLLLGEAARPDQRDALHRALQEPDEVEDVVELLTMYTGPKSLLVAARIDLADGVEARRVEELAEELDERLREAVQDVDQVFLDPTTRRSG